MSFIKKALFTTSALAIIPVAVAYSSSSSFAGDSVLADRLDKASTEAFPEVTPGSVGYAILHGTPWIDLRYRYETVDQDGIAKNARASTLSSKIGYKTGLWKGFQFAAEGENISVIGSERYNSTTNGKTQYPVVADPEDTLLNQLYISYQGIPKTNITVGRQYIKLDDQRFVGAVGWRQNDQTFDAASISSNYIENATFYYAYVRKVNRIFGPDANNGAFDSNSHLINLSYTFHPALKVTLYDYMLDFDDARSLSSVTYGARLSGSYDLGSGASFIYKAEFADQSDYADNPNNYSANYYAIEPGVTWSGWTAKIGYEVLEGDGVATNSFQTPLATLHAFNGWADKFLSTPANGLEDRYASLAYKVPFGNEWFKGTNMAVIYHDFKADKTNADYGTEWDAVISKTFFDHYTVGVKFADYDADNLFTDTTKVIATLQVKY
ncbi:MAG: alginate export family protein [Rickettsiales bacterium]